MTDFGFASQLHANFVTALPASPKCFLKTVNLIFESTFGVGGGYRSKLLNLAYLGKSFFW